MSSLGSRPSAAGAAVACCSSSRLFVMMSCSVAGCFVAAREDIAAACFDGAVVVTLGIAAVGMRAFQWKFKY